MKRVASFLLLLFMVMSLSCTAENIDFKSMESSEKEFIKNQKKNLLIYMGLDEIYRDPLVRELAGAAAKGNVGRIDSLVEGGVDVNSKGKHNATPLFWAISNEEGFNYLLKLGADPNVVFDDGGSILHWLVVRGKIQLLKAALASGGDPNLISSINEDSLLYLAIGSPNELDSVELLIGAGANVNGTTSSGNTAAMLAAGYNHFETVAVFVKNGVDASIRNESGETLLEKLQSKTSMFDKSSDKGVLLFELIEQLEAKH
ncbi:ankyrin repeat domain-containing protein [Microbulbifer sp. SSSA005]|uniref:ankyrin repeat domain-containing protein n=1 Tax=Microbulbifer sp. SSSA005 TaxID=3243378 RepID=UPI00403A58CA